MLKVLIIIGFNAEEAGFKTPMSKNQIVDCMVEEGIKAIIEKLVPAVEAINTLVSIIDDIGTSDTKIESWKNYNITLIQVQSLFSVDYKKDYSMEIYTIEGRPIVFNKKYPNGVIAAQSMNLKVALDGSATADKQKPSSEIQELVALSKSTKSNFETNKSSTISDVIYTIIGMAFIGGMVVLIIAVIKKCKKTVPRTSTPRVNPINNVNMKGNIPKSLPKYCCKCGVAVTSSNDRYCTKCGANLYLDEKPQ